jgi:Na+/glutamate symporter
VRNRAPDFAVFNAEPEMNPRSNGRRVKMLLIVLAILALILFGVGFVVHWLFIIAAIVALIWLISLFTGGFGRSGARL